MLKKEFVIKRILLNVFIGEAMVVFGWAFSCIVKIPQL